jgi:SAM-dependent methyltransferase
VTVRAEQASLAELRSEVIRLGPWHLDVEVTPELSTSESLDAPAEDYPPSLREIGFVSPRESFIETFKMIYPNGLEGRSVLDCACNCGGYLFWAKELGAGRCFGFDVREHWINQARFLAQHREGPGSDINFEVCDLYELPKLGLEPFDIVFFRGIFYHLPDPITGLNIAADLTRELIVVNTATRGGLPDGLLSVSGESRTHVMSGVYGLNWFPTGPKVLDRILKWAGFSESRCSWWIPVPGQQPGTDRLELMACREPGYFAALDATKGPRWREVLRNTVPPETTVLVAHEADEDHRAPLKLQGRRAWRFPPEATWDATGNGELDSAALIARLEELRSQGAEYLVLPTGALALMERHPEFSQHVRSGYRKISDEDETCLIFILTEPR